MRPTRILHCIFNAEIGGMQNGLVNLLNHLQAPDLTHAVCAYAPAPGANGSCFARIRNPNCQVFQLQRSCGNDPRLLRHLVGVIRQFKPDVIHTRNWATYGEGAAAATLAGTPCLIHGEHGTPYFDGWKHKWAYRLLALKTRLVVTVSESLRRLYHATCGRWAARAQTIRNGVDDVRFAPAADRAAARAALGLPVSALVIGSVGRLVPVKGYDILLRAVAQVCKAIPRAHFVIVGPGPEFGNLTALAQALGVQDSVTFTGACANAPAVYHAMDLYVSTSRWEGISNTILEALASGVPVIGTAVGGTPEVLQMAGPSGALISPDDANELALAIVRWLDDPAHLRRRREAARDTIRQHFSLEKMLRSYESMYRSCVS